MISKIADNFYRITLPIPFRLKHVHVYALTHNDEVALFDAGYNSRSALKTLENDMESIGQNIKSVRDIYITHGHVDHSSLAGVIQEKSRAAIHLSATADQNNRNLQLQNMNLVLPVMKKFYLPQGLKEEDIENFYSVVCGLRSVLAAFKADNYLQDNEIREFGRRQFEVIFTPGHLNDHVSFYFRKEGFLLSGDTIMRDTIPNLSPNIIDETYRPLQSFLESLKKVESLPIRKIYAGHSEVIEDAKARIKEMREYIDKQFQLTLNSLGAAPKTTLQISQEIFSDGLTTFDNFMAVNEAYSYLQELRHQGLIHEEQDGNVVIYRRQ